MTDANIEAAAEDPTDAAVEEAIRAIYATFSVASEVDDAVEEATRAIYATFSVASEVHAASGVVSRCFTDIDVLAAAGAALEATSDDAHAVIYAVDSATRDAVDSATRDAVGTATRDAVGTATRGAFDASIVVFDASIDDAVHYATLASIDYAVTHANI